MLIQQNNRARSDGSGFVHPSPEAEELVENARVRARQGLGRRERIGELTSSAGFLAAAVSLAALAPMQRETSIGMACALLVAYALASRIKFHVRTNYTVPTQLVFIPMLFLLPPALVPLLVAAAHLLGDLPDYVTGRRHSSRTLISISDSWYALGPALILVLAGAPGPQLDDWPLYTAVLAAQFAVDFLVTTVGEWYTLGLPPRLQLADSAWIYTIDALLSPLGLLAAGVQGEGHEVFLLVLPLVGVLAFLSRERLAHLEHAVELRNAYRGTTMLLGELIQEDDEYTGKHSHTVVSATLAVADALGLSAKRRRNAEFAALLHDIGKIAVPKKVLNKPGPLTPGEWALMKLHTIEGQRMLDRVGGVLQDVGEIVRASHERWDGSGYPDGLAGEKIPIEARIVSCCDAFDAMVSDRPYRPGMPVGDAVAELRNCAGRQFDPAVVEALIGLLPETRADLAA